MSNFDKHDKVNYAVTNANFTLNKIERKVTKTLMDDDKVECVYLTNYQSQENEKGAICLEALVNDTASYVNYESLVEKINRDFEKINTTDILVDFSFDYVRNYSIIALNPSEVHRVERLTESSIIFDKSENIKYYYETDRLYKLQKN